ncbi:uncharacterized protein TNCV_4901261 [Trichonephila clavipes]|nr:uncharacterized protein TNCV_4901261 [Trichonephila clavipes]
MKGILYKGPLTRNLRCRRRRRIDKADVSAPLAVDQRADNYLDEAVRLADKMKIISQSFEHRSLRPCVNTAEDLSGVHFHTELLSHTNKNSDVPEYLRQLALEGALKYDGDRTDQTALSRFLSGHLKYMTFESGRKTFQTCPKCHLLPDYPEHILDCLRLALEDVHASPLLVLEFARVNDPMDVI